VMTAACAGTRRALVAADAPRLLRGLCVAAAAVDVARAAETPEHDTSTEGAGWRSPTRWGSLVIIISLGMGMAIAKVYRERVIPVCLKFPVGQRVHGLVPVAFALVLMLFYFEAGLYLIMDGESGVWHVLVGFVTLVGGSYYSWHVYAWSLPDEAKLIEMLNKQQQAQQQAQQPISEGARLSSYEREEMNGGGARGDEL
jgi:hypothetical protein